MKRVAPDAGILAAAEAAFEIRISWDDLLGTVVRVHVTRRTNSVYQETSLLQIDGSDFVP